MTEKPRRYRCWLWLFIASITLASLILVGCSDEQAQTDPTPTSSAVLVVQTPPITPSSTVRPTNQPTQTTTGTPLNAMPSPSPTTSPASLLASPTPTYSSTSTPTPTAPDSGDLPLTVLAPQDGMGVEIDTVRVMGATRADAAVGVNGTPVEVSPAGMFQCDISLVEGINGIEVDATDLSGNSASEYAVVFLVSPTAGLPLSVFYPYDGLRVGDPEVQVIGGTRQDAVVGVNGHPVAVDANGMFSASVHLEEGLNLIEVVAADASQNVRFQTATVFYVP